MDKIPKYQMLKHVQHDKLYNASHCKSKKCAFTLAEVLITLTIIGVIAALTIPNLLQKYQEQATVKKVQKFYSNLSNAYKLAMEEHGPANEWGLTGLNEETGTKIYELQFKPYFKISKICGIGNKGKCSTVIYKKLNNEITGSYGGGSYPGITLDDGATFFIRPIDDKKYNIYYDINGRKGPNQWGNDVFVFVIINDKVLPAGIQSGEYSTIPFNTYCKMTNSGQGCAAWVIYKGNMDYLHCDGLKWTSRSCKEK